jgi:organic radical activating enzyme
MDLFYLQIITTRACNQKCYYCNTFEDETEITVDIDFLNHLLDNSPENLGIELTGGEIGLVNNIDDVFKTLYSHHNVKHIIVLSNGLIRKRGVDWLDKVDYWEHLIYEIDGLNVMKFYPELSLEPISKTHKFIVVTTENTTKSLIQNFEFYEKNGFLQSHFFYKLMNMKTHTIKNYLDEIKILYSKLNDEFHISMIDGFINKNNIVKKLWCSKNSPNIFIDLETRKLGHCAVSISKTKTIEYSDKNFISLFKGELFDNYDECCRQCYVFDNGIDKKEYIKNCKNENFMNRSYKQ